MICHLCNVDKLSKEFPFDPLTEQCDHPLLHCLDCVIASVEKNNKCSQCENVVNKYNKKYQEYLETLDFLFPNVEEKDDAKTSGAACSVLSGNLVVTTLAGECANLAYSSCKRILDIKQEIESILKIPSNKQRLLYQKTELKNKTEHQLSTLKDYNVPPNSTLHLIILLCAVPDDLEDAVFDFYWGYPPDSRFRKDFLDVSVLIYSGSKFLDAVYWKHSESYACPGVTHSGPAQMDDFERVGHQKVNVSVKLIPPHVDNLFFTLSAWGSSNISKYPSPSLRFYDVNSPERQLCNDSLRSAADYRSVIMCSLSKKSGQWFTESLQVGSDGFTRNFSPIKRTISTLILMGRI